MRKKLSLILILVLISQFLLGCSNSIALVTDELNLNEQDINSYVIEVILDSHNKSYTSKQTTTYIINSEDILDEIYFHLYSNAYKTLENAPILFNRFSKDPKSYKEGYIDILKISNENEDLNFIIMGEDETILKVELNNSLKPKESIDIYMEYIAKLPSIGDRFGYGLRTMNFGNWYPIACVYEDTGWNLEPYSTLK